MQCILRNVDMEKRLAWALEYKDDDFEDAIYTRMNVQTLLPFLNDVYPSGHRLMAQSIHP